MRVPMRSGLCAALAIFAITGVAASPALAETHPPVGSFGSFTNPNGIAVEESTGDVYVADLGTDTVSKFDANGTPVNFNFPAGSKEAPGNTLKGADTPAKSFSFPEAPGSPAAIAVDNSCAQQQPALSGSACEAFDPSFGDLYVMDAGHDVIDKFNAAGKALQPITGPFDGELLGLGVDAAGNVRVDVKTGVPASDVFDNSLANSFVTHLQLEDVDNETGVSAQEYGFAATGQPGDGYFLLSCGCIEKSGPYGELLGLVDSGSEAAPAPVVAAAVDPATGHLYLDGQSSVTEWDTGQMNGTPESGQNTGSPVSSFGSRQLTSSSGQGGIAVNGASGKIYVSNPAAGNVYVFASTAPAAAAAPPTGVTKTEATLHATVNPNGGEVTICKFEYDTSPSTNLTTPIARLVHSVPCEQTPEQIGAGAEPVEVSARIAELQPGSLYHFRLVAANAAGVAPSSGLFPTVAPGFGIKKFEVAFLNENGTPDTQAGSHPYKLVNNIEFNTEVIRRGAQNLTYIAMPAGNVKDVTVDLPPGFIGDPNATTKKCTLELLSEAGLGDNCPAESEIGTEGAEVNAGFMAPSLVPEVYISRLLNIVPPPGVAFQMSAHIDIPNAFIDVGLPAGGDSGLSATAFGIPVTAPIFKSQLTVYGVPPNNATAPLETMPTACNGPLTSTISADSYQEPGQYATASSVTRNAAGAAAGMTGCAKLLFPPAIEVKPDVPDASSSSGLTVGVHISQKAALNPNGLAESGVRDLTVALPPGVALNPADADGLEACSADPSALAPGELGSPGDQFGYLGPEEFNPALEPGDQTATFTPEPPNPLEPGKNFCPNGAKIGTVDIATPLLPKGQDLTGSVYLAAQEANPFGSLLAIYLIAEDPVSGTIIKQTGKVALCENTGEVLDGVSCEAPGQIVATLENMPDDPFEEAELHFFGGERAPLRTPSRCGTYTTKASYTPWDGNAPVNTTSSFEITSGPNGSPCPGASLPFDSSANAGSTNLQAGAFSPFTLSFTRHDGEQNVQSVTATLPPGLSGMLSNIALCQEPQANEGTCPEGSLIGTTTVSVGVGSDPFVVTGGKDYLTGPYNGSGGCTMGTSGCAPFGLTFEVPAKAGPFDLEKTAKKHPACDCLVVRGKVEINPITSALTITTDPPGSPDAIPTMLEGIPLEIQQVNATTTRSNFQFNPTNCAKMALVGHLFSTEDAADTIELPYQVTNCAALKFEPKLAVSTQGTDNFNDNGASLTAKVSYPAAPQGTQADIAKFKVELPKALPSRLTTLQKACLAKVFEADPAACPPASLIGHAVVHTPLIPVPLEGPAIFVSHGGEAFPSLIMVLQGYGVTIDLVGTTFISHAGITSTTFKTLPDQPFSTFELVLPEGKYSALASNTNVCKPTTTEKVKQKVTVKRHGKRVKVTRKVSKKVAAPLEMPTEIIGQNGAEIHETTPISVTGCKASKPKAKKKGKKAKKKGKKK